MWVFNDKREDVIGNTLQTGYSQKKALENRSGEANQE